MEKSAHAYCTGERIGEGFNYFVGGTIIVGGAPEYFVHFPVLFFHPAECPFVAQFSPDHGLSARFTLFNQPGYLKGKRVLFEIFTLFLLDSQIDQRNGLKEVAVKIKNSCNSFRELIGKHVKMKN